MRGSTVLLGNQHIVINSQRTILTTNDGTWHFSVSLGLDEGFEEIEIERLVRSLSVTF